MGNLKDINYGIGKYLELSDASAIPGIGNNRKNLDLLNFKVAVNNAYALYNFKDGMIDAYQTEAGVDTGGSTNDSYDSTNKIFSPTVVAAAITAVTATGAATWTCPTGVTSAEILVVAGGGGGRGGSDRPCLGGGGAGGVVHASTYPVTAGVEYDLSVGAGGGSNTNGTNSVFNVNGEGSNTTVLTANGGGTGGGRNNAGSAGGSGGGGGGGDGSPAGGASNQPASFGTPQVGTGYGNAGGTGSPAGAGENEQGAGGGGANATGGGADGGIGKEFSAFSAYGTDSSNSPGGGYFGGGGGGSRQSSGGAGSGGAGGGGAGKTGNPNSQSGDPGIANTGGGGGAAKNNGSTSGVGGTGGSGFIGIKTAAVQTNMTLISNVQTAFQADPTEGRLMLYEEDVDSVTLDTDIKGYVSRDGGTNYTQTLLTLDSTITHPASLLLHCDGSNDGTTFTDSSFWQHVPTVAGSTHTDTAVKKFGTASAQFDGTDDYLDYASSLTFGFGTGDWTIDFWVRSPNWSAGSGYGTPFDMRPGSNLVGCPRLFFDTGNGNIAGFNNGGSGTQCSSNVAQSNDTWYHIAVVKYNNVTKVYTDGVTGASGTYPVSYADTIDYRTENVLRIGDTSVTSDPYAFNGYIDEFRITKGIARWTANFSPSTSAYTGTEGDQRLLSGSVDISGQPAGSNMKYKVETLNEKNLKLHGASLLWA